MRTKDTRKPITVRLPPEIHDILKERTKEGVSTSYLIRKALEEFLGGKSVVGRSAVTAEEIEAILPALKIIGKPVHADLFFELIETQQGR